MSESLGSSEPNNEAKLVPVKQWQRTVGPDEPINDWLHGCEICNQGLINRVESLQDKGYSQRKAVKKLEKEQVKRFGAVLYPAETLRTRIKRSRPTKKKKVAHNDQHPIKRKRLTNAEKEKIISDGFEDAFEILYDQVLLAKNGGWKSTSKEAALKQIEILYDVVTIT